MGLQNVLEILHTNPQESKSMPSITSEGSYVDFLWVNQSYPITF
jgi:hypothetical protein